MKALLLALFIILNISVLLSLGFKKKIDYTIPVSNLIIIVTFYILGLLGFLSKAIYILFFLNLIVLIINSYFIYKNWDEAKDKIFTRGFLIFLLSFIFLFIFHIGRVATVTDEFSHWVDVVKVMFTYGCFSTSKETLSAFPAYPPAMSLYQLFFQECTRFFKPEFREYYMYISYHLLTISLYLPFLTKIKSNFKYIVSLMILFLLPLCIFTMFLYAIYVDPIISILTCYSLLNVLLLNKIEQFDVVNISLTIFVLVLLKDSCLIMAILSLLLFFIKFKPSLKNKTIDKRFIITIIISIFLLLLARYSWSYNVNINNVKQSINTHITFGGIIDIIRGHGKPYQITTINNFRLAIINKPILGSLSYASIFVMLCVGAYILNKREKFKFKYILLLFISLILYTIGMLLLYLFKFAEIEAINLASFYRYLGTFLLIILLIEFIISIRNEKNFVYIILITILILPSNVLYNNFTNKEKAIETRYNYNIASNTIKSYAKESDKVYIIIQNTTGYEFWQMRFVLRPIKINPNFTWSIGTKYTEGDIWTKEYDKKTWMNILLKEKYSFVYLHKIDDQFISEFKPLFSRQSKITEGSIYKIDKKNKKLVLIKHNKEVNNEKTGNK